MCHGACGYLGEYTRHTRAKVSFSSLKEKDLKNLGIACGLMPLHHDRLAALVSGMTQEVRGEVTRLKDRLVEVHTRVSMGYPSGWRTIIDSVLLTVGRIVHHQHPNLDVVICPGMMIAARDGVLVKNPASGYELLLGGNVDHALILYEDEAEVREHLLAEDGVRDDVVFKFSQGCIFIVEAKSRPSDEDDFLDSYIPEAVGQGIAWAKVTDQTEVRFCLSNGHTWIFCILKSQDDSWTYYWSAPLEVTEVDLKSPGVPAPLSNVVHLVLEWLVPSAVDLYECRKFHG